MRKFLTLSMLLGVAASIEAAPALDATSVKSLDKAQVKQEMLSKQEKKAKMTEKFQSKKDVVAGPKHAMAAGSTVDLVFDDYSAKDYGGDWQIIGKDEDYVLSIDVLTDDLAGSFSSIDGDFDLDYTYVGNYNTYEETWAVEATATFTTVGYITTITGYLLCDNGVTYNYTMTKDSSPKTINISGELVWEYYESDGDYYIVISDDTYDVYLDIFTTTFTGHYTEEDLFAYYSYIEYGTSYPPTQVGYESADITITGSDAEGYTLNATLVGDDGNTYIVTGTKDAKPELVELPVGAVVETWYAKYTKTASSGTTKESGTVNIAFVGGDVYVQGLIDDFPTAWVKGTVTGSVVTFPAIQYVGDFSSYFIYAAGVNTVTSALVDFKMSYDADALTLTSIEGIDLVGNAKKDELYPLSRYTKMLFSVDEPQDPTYTIPYFNALKTVDDAEYFTIIDANADGKTWLTTGGSTRYTYNSSSDADDWLVTPGIILQAGKKYSFSIDVRSYNANYPERFEVMMGNDKTVAALTTEVIASTEVANGSFSTYTGVVSALADGTFYFGVHAISDADMWTMYVQNLVIEEYVAPAVLNEGGFATFSYAEDATIATEGIKAYKAAVSGDVITLTELEGYIPAGTGVLLYSETQAGDGVDVEAAAGKAADVAGNDLLPTTLADGSLAVKTSDDVYALGANNEFLHFTGSAFVPNRAYLIYTGSAARLTVEFEDATGIRTIATEAQRAAVIDLLGRQIENNQKGLQINNGKVVLVK